ncbi:MAG: acyloxyacyl hydrolase, partial [Panacibacter sp.]
MFIFGQHATSVLTPKQHELGINLHYGAVYAQSIYVKNTAGAKPVGLSFEIAKRKTDTATFNNFGCFPRTGIMLSYINLNTPILGNSFTAAYLFEPTFRINNKMDWYIKARFGLSYLTNPNDSLKNPDNQTYSQYVNIFTAVGIGIDYKINDHFSCSLAANFLHNSNGGFKQPNRGLNYPGLSAGIKY